MDSDQPERGGASSAEQHARLCHQLAHAERRLEDAKSMLLNVSGCSDANTWGATDPHGTIRELNARIRESQDIEALEEDVARLRRRVESLPRP